MLVYGVSGVQHGEGREERGGPYRHRPGRTSERLAHVALDDAGGLRELLAEKRTYQLSRQALALCEALEAGDDLARRDVDQYMPVPTAVGCGTVLRARETAKRRRGVPRHRDHLPTFQGDGEAATVPGQGDRQARPGASLQVGIQGLRGPCADRGESLLLARLLPSCALVNVGADGERGNLHRSPHDFRTPNDFQRRNTALRSSRPGPVSPGAHADSHAMSQPARSSAAWRQSPSRGSVKCAI